LSKIKSGDSSPIHELYELYRNEFIKWGQSNYKVNCEQAKDCFQDAMIDFHQNVVSGKLTELTSSVKTYIFQIGKFKILNLLKKESRITYHDNLQIIKGKEFEDFMDDDNNVYSQEQISEAITKLPSDCQKVLKLYYFNEFDMESIARELEYKNANTAKSKKSLCMKGLIKELTKLVRVLLVC
jgi:RNA polymerase sigma-70 factor (ECF subfamily)